MIHTSGRSAALLPPPEGADAPLEACGEIRRRRRLTHRSATAVPSSDRSCAAFLQQQRAQRLSARLTRVTSPSPGIPEDRPDLAQAQVPEVVQDDLRARHSPAARRRGAGAGRARLRRARRLAGRRVATAAAASSPTRPDAWPAPAAGIRCGRSRAARPERSPAAASRSAPTRGIGPLRQVLAVARPRRDRAGSRTPLAWCRISWCRYPGPFAWRRQTRMRSLGPTIASYKSRDARRRKCPPRPGCVGSPHRRRS